ncbi:MAG: ABC transporter ATP-binding protein [Chloroflexi bacterium]|nr:ABC transporter ATP-binding protein [Chloroflexota bacterium]
MTRVELDKISKHYQGGGAAAVDRISLDVDSGSIVALLGMSGSGKTTLLKIIAGIIDPSGGDVRFDGQSVRHLPTERRGAIMVFQNHLLFPHMTVEQNIAFGLRMQGLERKLIQERVAEMLRLIQLPGLGKRRPAQLSGGQQQRVALARALVVGPRVLLLDEPLSNLDAGLRDEMRELILRVQQHFKITTLIVTHDQQDAVVLANRIALMREGKLQQFATPDVLFHRPETEAVARFFGGMNFLPAHVLNGAATTSVGAFRTDADHLSGEVTLTIRPERIQFAGQETENRICGAVERRQFMGTTHRYQVRISGDVLLTVDTSSLRAETGEIVSLYLPPEDLWLMRR